MIKVVYLYYKIIQFGYGPDSFHASPRRFSGEEKELKLTMGGSLPARRAPFTN
jgi:hypothetical protein